jgi:hypothetical protein
MTRPLILLIAGMVLCLVISFRLKESVLLSGQNK